MRRFTKFGLIGLAAVMALSFGFTAIAAAQSTDGGVADNEGPGQMFVGKLADILGLEEGQVSDAMQQSRQEMMEEFQAQRLQTAIDEGLITEEEAGEIQGWWDGRPEAMQQLGQMGRHMGGMRCFK